MRDPQDCYTLHLIDPLGLDHDAVASKRRFFASSSADRWWPGRDAFIEAQLAAIAEFNQTVLEAEGVDAFDWDGRR